MDSIISIIRNKEYYKLRAYRYRMQFLRDYLTTGNAPIDVYRIHRKGFTVNDYKLLGIEDADSSYLTSRQYCSIHPINGQYSSWIDDKLTFWYLCMGTSLQKNMPEYFWQISDGSLLPLPDNRHSSLSSDYDELIMLLKERQALAFKMVKGSIGKGFYKAEWQDESYMLNGQRFDKESFIESVSSLDGYIVCEYLKPHSDLAAVFPSTPNTFRYLECRINRQIHFLKSFIRFGSSKTGYVENFNAGGVLCYIDEQGHFDSGYIINRSNGLSTTVVSIHPDTNTPLRGTIPLWDEVKDVAQSLGTYFPQLDYLGIDFVVTDDCRVVILEVNSLTSLDAIQLDCSLLDTQVGRQFFSSRIS